MKIYLKEDEYKAYFLVGSVCFVLFFFFSEEIHTKSNHT